MFHLCASPASLTNGKLQNSRIAVLSIQEGLLRQVTRNIMEDQYRLFVQVKFIHHLQN